MLTQLVLVAALLASSLATYCLQSTSTPQQYTYCNSGYRCCPGYGCCSVSAMCCYAPLNSYANGCCGFGTTCCTDSYSMLCCTDDTEECCVDEFGNAKCCSLRADRSEMSEVLYAIVVVLFACLVGVLALCVHFRSRQQTTNNRVMRGGNLPSPVVLSLSNRGQPNDFDDFDRLPAYKAQTPPPKYEEILLRVTEIDRACVTTQPDDHDDVIYSPRDLTALRASVIVRTDSESSSPVGPGPSGISSDPVSEPVSDPISALHSDPISALHSDPAGDSGQTANENLYEAGEEDLGENIYEDPEDYMKNQTTL